MRAVVAGGTGLVGRALLEALALDSTFTSIVSLARRAHEAPPRVETSLGFDVPPCDVGFCALGTTIKNAGSQAAFRAVDHDLVVGFARSCKAAGARSFHVVSAVGADPAARVFYSRVKGEMERDVQALAFDLGCAYRPGFLLGERAEWRPGERAGIVATRLLGPLVPARYRGVRVEAVARAMTQRAKSDDRGWHAHENADIERFARGAA